MKNIKYLLMIAGLLIAAQTASAALITSATARNADAAPVLGGILTDPALVWIDRPQHRIEGVPEILVNKAEYVKVNITDREKPTVEYDINLSTDADVYLLIDNRVGKLDNSNTTPPVLTSKMTWVAAMGFTRIEGVQIGIDESWATADGIDNWFSIYKANFSAGTVTFKEQNDGGTRAQYIIAAVSSLPLAKNPTPADKQGQVTNPSDPLFPGVLTDTNLSWTAPNSSNIDPNFTVEYRVFMDPNQTKVSTGTGCAYFLNFTTATQFDPSSNLAYVKDYYWKVDTKVTLKGRTDPNIFSGSLWSFKTVAEDKAPIAQAGGNLRTWLARAQSGVVQLNGSVLFPEADSTVKWTAYKAAFPGTVPAPEVTFANASNPATTVTISATGEYILQLTATDDTPSIPPSVSQMKIIVYADTCQAAQNTAGYAKNVYDFDNNCVVDLADMNFIAKEWLKSTSATADIFYATTVIDPRQGLVAEYWLNIPGGSDPNLLLNDPRYPNSPTGSELITGTFKFTGRNLDHYGQRIRGYIVAPTTGDYTFYVSSDDSSRLFLSTDTNPANAVMIAYTGYVTLDNWTANTTQKSAAIFLTAGQYYYVEALLMENDGGEHISVGWKKPGDTTIEVVPGTALRWYLP